MAIHGTSMVYKCWMDPIHLPRSSRLPGNRPGKGWCSARAWHGPLHLLGRIFFRGGKAWEIPAFETWESKIHLGSGLKFCPKNIDPQHGEIVGDVEVVDYKPVNLWGYRKVLVGNVMVRNCQPL